MKRIGLFISLLFASSLFFVGCGGSSTVDADTPQTIAIEKIKAYAEDQTQPIPTVEDYADAGVEGVSEENLDEINALVAELTAEDVDTSEEIQAILDEYNLSLVDVTPPVITLLGETPVTVTQGETYTDAGATASDDTDGDITTNIVTVNNVDTATVGTYTVTYNVSDAAGNAADEIVRTVNVIAPVVEDTTAPVITLLGETPVTVTQGETYTDAGATASDDTDGDITTNIVTINNVDTATVGIYTVTYNVSDAAGNAADEVVRTVNVVAPVNTAPVAVATADPTDVNNTATPNALISLDGSGSSDADSDPLTYSWSLTAPAGSTAALSDTAIVDPTFNIDVVGSYVATLVVNDGTDDSAPSSVTITVTDGTVDAIVGKTIEFAEVSGSSFSFYPNNKFVRVLCDGGVCADGTGTFEYIGTWSGSTNGTDASGLTLLDNLSQPITVATISSSQDIYHFPVVANKDLPNNVQGDGVRERKPDGSIIFVYFRDPDATQTTAFSAFGFDIASWDPVGAGGHWEIRDGKVYAYYGVDVNSEISTYAFDRQPVKNTGGPILTVTKGGDLVEVIAVQEYWQLKPPPTDLDKTTEVTRVDMEETTFYDKLMLITDKVDGPSGCYFDAPVSELVNGYVTCAGISIDGSTIWGGKGDNWYINGDKDLETKIHYEVAGSNSTTEVWKFNEALPSQGTLVSKYDKDGNFVTTQALTDFRDF